MRSLRLDSAIAALRRVLLIIGVSGLAGVLVAGLVLPVAAALGLTARESANAFTDLPAKLDVKPLAEQSRIVDATGATLATFYDQNRVTVTLDKIAPVMQQAILAIEDHRFYEHGPIDFQGTARALLGNLDAGDLTCDYGCTAGGGSTLTQQYVKLVLQDQATTPEERRAATISTGAEGYVRKLRELRLAANVENQLSKDQILERYLNIAYFGGGGGSGGAYGVEAAARYFFSTTAAQLTLNQAALLAGLVQAPSEYDPTDNPEKAIGRRNQVLSRMGEIGMITPTEASQARLADLGLKLKPTRAGCVSTWAPFFCDYVHHELLLMEELGATPDERERNILRGGLTITTTLDPKAQRAAQDAMSDRIASTDSAVGSLAMVEPGAGTFNLRTGTERSVNTFYVQLLQRTGICEPATIAQQSGVFKQVPFTPEDQPLDQVASFTLGSNTVSPLAMAEGYAMFAARGMHCNSMAVLQVRDRDDAVIVDRKPTCNRVLDEGVADGVNDVLRGVIHNSGATGTRMELDGGRVAAGKTGTTNNSIAVWFVGYTPQLTTAVAVADLDGEQESLDGRTYNGERIRSACGGCIAGPIWKKTMDAA